MSMPFLFKSLGLTKPATLGSTLADMKCSLFMKSIPVEKMLLLTFSLCLSLISMICCQSVLCLIE